MSYNTYNPKTLKDAILRRLGAPVINVEVTEDQIYDCIQRALELYGVVVSWTYYLNIVLAYGFVHHTDFLVSQSACIAYSVPNLS